MGTRPGGGVGIHPRHLRVGAVAAYFGLDPLRAEAEILYMTAPALRTDLGRGCLVIAVMAYQFLVLKMIHQYRVASFTFQHQAARLTVHERRKSASIEKYDRLLSVLQSLIDGVEQDL